MGWCSVAERVNVCLDLWQVCRDRANATGDRRACVVFTMKTQITDTQCRHTHTHCAHIQWLSYIYSTKAYTHKDADIPAWLPPTWKTMCSMDVHVISGTWLHWHCMKYRTYVYIKTYLPRHTSSHICTAYDTQSTAPLLLTNWKSLPHRHVLSPHLSQCNLCVTCTVSWCH